MIDQGEPAGAQKSESAWKSWEKGEPSEAKGQRWLEPSAGGGVGLKDHDRS